MAGKRRHLRAVRVRATVITVLAVALALVAGGTVLVLGLRAELSNDVRDAARARAREVARVIEAGRGVPEVTVADPDEEYLQVVDEQGTVVASSSNVEGLPALARLRPGDSTEVDTPIDEDPFLVVAVGARDGERRLTVLDGRTPAGVAEATSTVTRMLLIGLPALLLLAAAATWVAVGRTLRWVAQAEEGQRRFVNLAENAARHASSQVSLTLGTTAGVVRLDVDDDGPGVPEGERARIFERFVRLDEARARRQGGSGLGLAIVAELVAVHGGTVRVGTAPGLGGARFTVTLAGMP
jgi:signal transduction histidine kinase